MRAFARRVVTFLCAGVACIALIVDGVPGARAATADLRLRTVDMTVAPEAVAGLIDDIATIGRAHAFAVRFDPEATIGRVMMYAPYITIVVAVGAPLGEGTIRVIVSDGPYQADAAALARWDRLLGTFCATRVG